MKQRYEKFVLEAGKDVTFDISEGTSGELIIRALNIATANVCSTNYVNPPIPEGYKHVCGEWNNGFVIERCSDGSQFVWIPVGSLDSNGTLDGEHFSEKFGRRNYMNDEFSDDKFNEALNGELLEQLESVKKYGGFYISRYNISKNSAGKPQSVKGVRPCVNINFDDAKKIASTIEDNEAVKSHLTFGAEYDSVVYSTNYVNPPIPDGYKHVCGEWNNGFVIERCSDGSQFVWIPVGSLDSNGTLDGEHFSEKFGRRNYMNDEFSDDKFNEALNGELLEQLESVKKYGGFYISRYNISKNSAGKPQSVKGVMPWVNINFDDAKKVASTIEDNEAVKSHLTFGAE